MALVVGAAFGVRLLAQCLDRDRRRRPIGRSPSDRRRIWRAPAGTGSRSRPLPATTSTMAVESGCLRRGHRLAGRSRVGVLAGHRRDSTSSAGQQTRSRSRLPSRWRPVSPRTCRPPGSLRWPPATAGVSDVGPLIQEAVSTRRADDGRAGRGHRDVLGDGLLRSRDRDAVPVLHHRQRCTVDHRGTQRRDVAARCWPPPSHRLLCCSARPSACSSSGIVSMTAVWLITWIGFGAYWGDPLGVFR